MSLDKNVVETLWQDAIFATISASKKVKEIYDSGDFEVNMKSDATPLTKADKIADTEIRERLRHTVIPLLSEEGRVVTYEERAKWSLFWLVDPIDGTKEFIKENGEFTVNVALIEDGRPIIGVICLPSFERLYFAARDFGSFRYEERCIAGLQSYEECAPRELLKRSSQLPLPQESDHRFTVVSSRSHLAKEMSSYFEALRLLHPDMIDIPQGSSKKFCMVAEGTADLYPRRTPTSEWDTAAGQAICELAGCEVVKMFKPHQPINYNKEDMRNPAFYVVKKNIQNPVSLPEIEE